MSKICSVSDQMPWIEKYRPTKLEDIILDDHTIKKIRKIIEDKDMPNLILPGVPGIGKTTTIKCIARALYGKYANEAVLELNASDDRGIKSVQEKIVSFCKKKMDLNDRGTNNNNKKYSEHKIIFLDEADNMTNKAQRLINILIEKYQKTTRFAFTCNNSSDIIEGIQSRCIILRFYRLRKEQIITRLTKICEFENVKIDKKSLETLAIISEGDLRTAINNLQLTFRSCQIINPENIYTICSKPQPIALKSIILNCINKDLIGAKTKILELKKIGYSVSDIILGLIYILKIPDDNYDKFNLDIINEKIKIQFLEIICHYAYIVSKGLPSDIQLIACVCSLISSQ
jgi:replication factor C subunit 2/4